MPGRGQYDRAAAKAKRPPVGTVIPIRAPRQEDAGDVLEIVQLRAELSKRDDLIARYAALLKRNGLWLDE